MPNALDFDDELSLGKKKPQYATARRGLPTSRHRVGDDNVSVAIIVFSHPRRRRRLNRRRRCRRLMIVRSCPNDIEK